MFRSAAPQVGRSREIEIAGAKAPDRSTVRRSAANGENGKQRGTNG